MKFYHIFYKKNIIIIFLIFCFRICCAQTTFQVCDKTPLKDTLRGTESFSKVIDDRFDNYQLFSCATDTLSIVNNYGSHSFMACIEKAFNHHYHLSISPDMVWLLLCQGFAIHVRQDKAKFEQFMVKHTGKKNLTRYRVDANTDSTAWQSLIENITTQIRENTKENMSNLMIKKFSTTGNKELYTYQIALMDAMSPYFEYEDYSLCGIPQITLEGSQQDWKDLKTYAQEFTKYGLDWWVKELNPIFEEFIAASVGKVNKQFWNSIYMINPNEEGCLGQRANGWSYKFFPYIKTCFECDEGIAFMKNPILGNKTSTKITFMELPNGISAVSFEWSLPNGGKQNMQLVAGFMGYTMTEETYLVRPYIHWAVLKQVPNKKND